MMVGTSETLHRLVSSDSATEHPQQWCIIFVDTISCNFHVTGAQRFAYPSKLWEQKKTMENSSRRLLCVLSEYFRVYCLSGGSMVHQQLKLIRMENYLHYLLDYMFQIQFARRQHAISIAKLS